MEPTSPGGWLSLGLLTGVGCLVGCGPVLLPFLVSCGPAVAGRSLRQLVEFLAGRVAAYGLLGVAALALGVRWHDWPGFRPLTGLATIALAALLLSHVRSEVGGQPRGCQHCCRARRAAPFAAGFALGLTPCAPLLLALNTLLSLEQWASGLAFLIGFAASATFWLLPVLGAGRLGRRESWREVARVLVALAGLWFLVRGWTMLVGGHG